MYPIILEKFHRQLISIYNDSKLDYLYLNGDIIITKLNDITWKSYVLEKYNEIINYIKNFNSNLVYPTNGF